MQSEQSNKYEKLFCTYLYPNLGCRREQILPLNIELNEINANAIFEDLFNVLNCGWFF